MSVDGEGERCVLLVHAEGAEGDGGAVGGPFVAGVVGDRHLEVALAVIAGRLAALDAACAALAVVVGYRPAAGVLAEVAEQVGVALVHAERVERVSRLPGRVHAVVVAAGHLGVVLPDAPADLEGRGGATRS